MRRWCAGWFAVLEDSRELSEDEGLAGLDFYAGEVELSSKAGEGGFDEVVLPCGDSAGDEEHVGLLSLSEGSVEGFSGVGCGGKHDGFGASSCDESRKHGRV